jgi:hypothetical protein
VQLDWKVLFRSDAYALPCSTDPVLFYPLDLVESVIMVVVHNLLFAPLVLTTV